MTPLLPKGIHLNKPSHTVKKNEQCKRRHRLDVSIYVLGAKSDVHDPLQFEYYYFGYGLQMGNHHELLLML